MSAFEFERREEKARKLITVLMEHHVSADLAREMDTTDWGVVAKVAHCEPPSIKTIELVIDRMSQIEKWAYRGAA